MEENVIISGKPYKIIFRNDETLFTVALFIVDDLNEDTIIITGLLPKLDFDNTYTLEGNYIDHHKYGVQFKVNSWEKQLPNSSEALVRYLSGPVFSGIGFKLASAIVEKVGVNALEEIKNNPDILNDIPRLTSKKKQTIIDNLFNTDDELEELMQFFMIHKRNFRL